MIWVKLALREIVHNKRFSLFFIFNLWLGLFGFISLDAFKTSFEESLHAQSKSMLTADLAVSAKRTLTVREHELIRNELGKEAVETQVLQLYSMVRSGTSQSRLA